VVAETPELEAPNVPAGGFPVALGLLWVALAVVLGVGLRFLHIPDLAVPLLVGVGVGAVVVIAAHYFLVQPRDDQPTPTRKSARPASTASRRLSGLKRRLVAPTRDVSDN
jgi:hypothetical protein